MDRQSHLEHLRSLVPVDLMAAHGQEQVYVLLVGVRHGCGGGAGSSAELRRRWCEQCRAGSASKRSGLDQGVRRRRRISSGTGHGAGSGK